MNHCFSKQFLVATVALLLPHFSPACPAQNESLASLNTILLEDIKDIEHQSSWTQLIKPTCPTMLSKALVFPQVPVIVTADGGFKELWLLAASQPEQDLKYDAVMAIARAHSRGMPGFEDTAPRLVQILESEEADHVLRLAAARALIVLNARKMAPVLKKQSTVGLDLARLIEPALAEWNDTSMHSVWLSRLREKIARPGLMILAVQAAAKTHLTEAVSPLRKILFDPTSAPHLQLEVARALAVLGGDKNISDAATLVSGTSLASPFLEHLLAAHLLARQHGPDAEALLTKLAEDPQPVTRAIALTRLTELDPKLTRPMLDDTLHQNDANLRMIAGKALYELRTPEEISRLSTLLDDPHPHVRSRAREWMTESDAVDTLSKSVREAAMQILASDRPRGLAQAAVLLGTLEHPPAADRLIGLLDHKAPDVAVASAWALRRLAIPETAKGVYEHLRLQTENSLIEIPYTHPSMASRWDMYEQHKHLIELLGLLRYQPADDLFRTFIPVPQNPPAGHPFAWIHSTFRPELRSRAIWALGRIHENLAPKELVPLLINEMDLDNVEKHPHVAAMCALALGRMKATSVEADLKKFYQPGMVYTQLLPAHSIYALASRAALEQITEATLPPMEVEPYETAKATTWFLEPLPN